MFNFVEYVWIDGTDPVKKLRSKTKLIDGGSKEAPLSLMHASRRINLWNFDGSSTGQAKGEDSERFLQPVCIVKDPVRLGGKWGSCPNFIALCEVVYPDGKPHESNTRAKLREILNAGGADLGALWGFEQEYVIYKDGKILGWPDMGYPGPQGPYYCGVGTDEIAGRALVEDHALACRNAGLLIYGMNAEVMLGQWEYQIGHRDFYEDKRNNVIADALTASDHLWLARWLLYRLGENHGVYALLDPKPIKGDWNGSGMHTNISTSDTMNPNIGMKTIENYMKSFEKYHIEHQTVYGHNNRSRLTGAHETCAYDDFKCGQANRGASIRIPNKTIENGYGYFEDRRPAANADPYVVTERILRTILTCY